MSEILGVNDRYYPMPDHSRDIVTRCVLVAGEIGDYAAYVGHGSIDFVARFGDKISFTEAKGHFPFIEKEKYRG